MSSKKQSEVKSTLDQISIVTAKFWVTGSGGAAGQPNMTGSWIFGTDQAMAIDFATTGTMALPSGSVRLVLPQDNRYMRMMDWGVSFEGSGSTLSSFAGTTGDQTLGVPQNFRIVKYAHNASSGTFDFGFVQQVMSSSAGAMMGTGHWAGAVPADNAHSNSPAAMVTFYAILRNTDRNT